MDGSIPHKLWRVASCLARHPRYAYRYALRGPLCPRGPLGLGLPWFSEAAIDFLSAYLKPEMEVFEWGSGGSTVYLAGRVRSVVAVEDDQAWLERVRQRLTREGRRNVVLKHEPYDFRTAIDFTSSGYLHAVDGRQADVIVVDGAEYDVPVRPDCFFRAENHVRPGGIIVVDDSWRYPLVRERSRAKEFRVFESTGPCRPGVTSTDVHFY